MHRALPELGVGVVFAPGLEELLEAGRGLLDFVEVEPETVWLRSSTPERPYQLDPRAFGLLRNLDLPRAVHGVGFPIGGSSPLDGVHLELFCGTIAALQAPWASEHLSINRVWHNGREEFAGFLLPPLQTAAGAATAVHNILRLTQELPVPFAFETGANYLRPRFDEIPDGEYYRTVATAAGCGIVLDLHNVWTNERNGRQRVLDLVAQLPLELVWEVHLAGGRSLNGYWLDAHSGLVSQELKDLANTVIPQLPNLKALTFEIVAEYVSAENIPIQALLSDLAWMKSLWSTRGTMVPLPHASSWLRPRLPTLEESIPPVRRWEETLGSLLHGDRESCRQDSLLEDPAGALYRQLIRNVRSGTIVDSLRLSTRLLRLTLGEETFESTLRAYLDETWPTLFPSDEAEQFARSLGPRSLDVPHLREVLDFELARNRRLIENAPQRVSFTCEPVSLLRSLRAGRLPAALSAGRYELIVE